MNSDFSSMQNFIKKTIKQAVEKQNYEISNLLKDISSKLSQINTQKGEENFREYRDTLLEISLKEFNNIEPKTSISQINILIRRWVGTLFDKLAKASFSGYYQGLLLEQQLKVYFSRNLINNFINFIECFQTKTSYNWAQLSKDVIKSFEIHSKSALNFLMSKYPQKDNADPDFYLSEMIPETQEKQINPVYDIIATSGYTFNYNQNGGYQSQIKSFVNLLIEQSKNKKGKFMNEIRSTFKIFKQNSEEMEEVWNSIGAKLSQTTKNFTQEEINSPGIEVKSSDVLRILIKWIQYIYQDIQHSKVNIGQRISGFIRKGKFLPKINEDGDQQLIPVVDLGLSPRQKNQLATGVESEFKYKIIEVQHDSNQKQNSLLSSLTKFISKNRQTFEYIDIVEFKTSLFSHIVSESVSNLVVSFLSHLIHILKRTINTVGKIDSDLADISLLKFGVMDLLRAKCEGTRDQILKVYNNIKNNPEFKIIRIKNRLKTGNKDFLINMQYKQSFLLCQIQLYVKSGDSDKKQSTLQRFSHFLYELQRSRYGSLSEAAIICSNLYNPVSYFRKTLVELNDKQLVQHKAHYLHPQYSNGTFYSQKFINNKNDFSFICHSCYRYFNAYSTFLDVLTHEDSKENICGECILELLGQQKSTQCILGDKMGPYFKRINMHNFQFQEQDYLIIVNKSYSRKLKALKYYSCYEFFSTVFSDHHSIRFYELKDVKQLTKNSYIFILNKQKLKLLPEIKMETLLIKQIKQMVSLSVFNDEDAISIGRSEISQQKNVPIIPINQDVNLVSKQQFVICYSYQGNSILVIDSVGQNNPIDSYLQTKRYNILQQHLKSKVDTWVAEDLMLSSVHLQDILDKNPGLVIRRIRFQNNLFKSFNIKLRDLEQLNLKFNKFQKLNFDDIPLYSLETLDLSFNQIQEIVNTNSVYLYNLQNLNISNNSINMFSLTNGSLPNLIKLNLSNNPIQKLQISPGYEFKNLVQFEMEQTLVISINLSNVSFPKLKTILLKRNDCLEDIILPTLEKIQSIDASKSQNLKNIKFNNYFVREIKSINLSNCNFTKAPTGYEFPDLQRLNISHNKLTHLDLSKAYLVALKQLNASCNKIQNIYLSKHSKCLQKLYLQKNHIKKIQIQSIGLNRLVEINLEQNMLESFHLNPSMTLRKLQLKFNPGRLSLLLGVDSTQVPFLEFLSLGINKKTKPYVEWVYHKLNKQEQEKFKSFILQANEPSMFKLLHLLEANNLPDVFKELKYFLKMLKKLEIPFNKFQKDEEINKHVTSLFKSAIYHQDFTQFLISPLMNTLNLQYDQNKLKQNKQSYSPKDSIKKSPSNNSNLSNDQTNSQSNNISNNLANIFIQSMKQQINNQSTDPPPSTNSPKNINNPQGSSLDNTLNFQKWNNYHQNQNYSFNVNPNNSAQHSSQHEPDYSKNYQTTNSQNMQSNPNCPPNFSNSNAHNQQQQQQSYQNYQQGYQQGYQNACYQNYYCQSPHFNPSYSRSTNNLSYPQSFYNVQEYPNYLPNYQTLYQMQAPSPYFINPSPIYYVKYPEVIPQSSLKKYPHFNQLYQQSPRKQSNSPLRQQTYQARQQPRRGPYIQRLTKSTSSVSLPPQSSNRHQIEARITHQETISQSIGSQITKKRKKSKGHKDKIK